MLFDQNGEGLVIEFTGADERDHVFTELKIGNSLCHIAKRPDGDYEIYSPGADGKLIIPAEEVER